MTYYYEKDTTLTIDPIRPLNVPLLQRLLQSQHFRRVMDYCLDLYESSNPGTKEALFASTGAAEMEPRILALLENPDVMDILQVIKNNPGLEKALSFQLLLFKKPASL
jgi:hypothetical protein